MEGLPASAYTIMVDTANVRVGVSTGLPQVTLHNNGDFITKGPWVDVRAFGAKGDDSTDNTVAIQNAINFASSTFANNSGYNMNPGMVFISTGIYRHRGVKVTQGITIQGAGWGTMLKNVNASSPSFALFGINKSTISQGFRLRDMHLFHDSGSTSDGVFISSMCNHVELGRLWITNAGRDCVHIEASEDSNVGANYTTILQPLFEGCRDGLHVNGSSNNGLVEGGRIGGNSRYGIIFHDTVTGTSSYPNTWMILNTDVPGNGVIGSTSSAGVYDNGHTNRYFGVRFEQNKSTDIALGTKSQGAVFVGTSYSGSPKRLLDNSLASPIFFEKNGQSFLTTDGQIAIGTTTRTAGFGSHVGGGVLIDSVTVQGNVAADYIFRSLNTTPSASQGSSALFRVDNMPTSPGTIPIVRMGITGTDQFDFFADGSFSMYNSSSTIPFSINTVGTKLAAHTIAELCTAYPKQGTGEVYYCSNCSPPKVVVSTGAVSCQFSDAIGGTFK